MKRNVETDVRSASRCMTRPSLLSWRIPSDLSQVDLVCQKAGRLLERHGLPERFFAVDLLLREFINNAIVHGNVSAPEKEVRVSMRVGRKWIMIMVCDNGPGFDWRRVVHCVPDQQATSGRGVAIGMYYAERVRFNRSGNEVTLWIKKDQG